MGRFSMGHGHTCEIPTRKATMKEIGAAAHHSLDNLVFGDARQFSGSDEIHATHVITEKRRLVFTS